MATHPSVHDLAGGALAAASMAEKIAIVRSTLDAWQDGRLSAGDDLHLTEMLGQAARGREIRGDVAHGDESYQRGAE